MAALHPSPEQQHRHTDEGDRVLHWWGNQAARRFCKIIMRLVIKQLEIIISSENVIEGLLSWLNDYLRKNWDD